MMGLTLPAGVATDSDSAFALLKVISDPERHKQMLEELIARTAAAAAAEASANEMHQKAVVAAAEAVKLQTELSAQQVAFKTNSEQRKADLDARDQALQEREQKLTAHAQAVTSEAEAQAKALAARETQLRERNVALSDMGRLLDERERVTAAALDAANKAKTEAENLRKQHAVKLENATRVLQTLAE